jgi:hypothetical protein
MINFNLRVLRESSSILDALVSRGVLVPVPDQVPGTGGQAYRPTCDPPRAQDHFNLEVAGKAVQTHLFALPPEEYAGLLAASPEFRQHRIAHLMPDLLKPMGKTEKKVWVRRLIEATRTTPELTQQPELLDNHAVQPATWHPEWTRFVRNAQGWLASLYFESLPVQATPGVPRTAVGVDVGLNTLAVAVQQTGLVHRAAGVQEMHIPDDLPLNGDANPAQLRRTVQLSAVLLQHAAARLELHRLVTMLERTASVVYIEDLHYRDCTPAFQRRSRELGLRDWMMVWLPQRLQAQGIPYQRVPPDRTSVYCHITHVRGERDPRDHSRFTNINGDVLDADVNAAWNVMVVGFAQRIQRGM